MLYNAVFTDRIKVIDGILHINDQPVERFEIEGQLGVGANGRVFKAKRKYLEQPCALKVWLTLRADDKRDKVSQGISEARKISEASPNWVARMYDADIVCNVFFVSMELLPGLNLHDYLEVTHSKGHLWELAQKYILGIKATTSTSTAHGDAHSRNVLVSDPNGPSLKFIDFGTSVFTKKKKSVQRHWNVAHKTFEKILNPFEGLTLVKERYWSKAANVFDGNYEYFRDVLFDLCDEADVPPFCIDL